MTKADEICMLAKDILTLVQKNIAADGKCLFDPVRVEMALEFAKWRLKRAFGRKAAKQIDYRDR